MATKTIGQIQVELDLATSKFNKNLAQIDKRIARFEKKTTRTTSIIKKSFVGIISIEATRRFATSILNIADRMTELQSRVRSATKDTGDFRQVWDSLGDITKETGANLSNTIDTFQRLSFVRQDLNATNDEMLRFTKAVQQLGVISGASTSEMSRGLIQLSQGLGEGTLRAQEWNSVLENTPAIARAIAEGFGVTTGQMRNLVIEGKVLSKDVFRVILDQTGDIQEAFNEMPVTIARATNELSTAWDLFIADLNESIGITEILVGLINEVTQGLTNFTRTGYLKDLAAEFESLTASIEGATLGFAIFEGQIVSVGILEERRKEVELLASGYTEAQQELSYWMSAEDDLSGTLKATSGGIKKQTDAMDGKNKKLKTQTERLKEDAEATRLVGMEYVEMTNHIREANDELDYWESAGTWDEAIRGVEGVNEGLAETSALIEESNRLSELLTVTWGNVMADLINDVSDAWSDFFLDVFHGEGLKSIEDFLNRVKEMFFQIIADIAAKWVTSQIFSALGIIGGGPGGILGGAIGGVAGGGGGLLGGIFGGAAATSSGAGGAAVGGVAIAGAGGAATVFPYVSATGTGVGGTIAGTALTGSGATVTSGAGGAAAAGGAFSGAAAAIPYVAVFAALTAFFSSGGRNIDDLLRGREDFSIFKGGAGGATKDIAGGFLEELESRGFVGPGGPVNVTDVGEGLSFTSRTGREGEPLVNLEALFEDIEKLKTLLPEIEELAAEAFETMNIGAGELSTAMEDGILSSAEQAQLGFIDLGDISAEQFEKITQSVNAGTLSVDGLTGASALTIDEMGRLGAIGVLSFQEIMQATGLSEAAVERLVASAREAGDAFVRAADDARSLARAASSIPSIPSGVSGKHSGGSFEVRGRAGVDANLVQFMATAGERIKVDTPGSSKRPQIADIGVTDLVNRMDRLISHLEAA